MATVTASAVETTDSLETFRQRFNTLRSDIQGLSFGGSLVFEGTTADDFETTLVITDPTADRTVTIQNKTGVLAMQGRDINDVVVMDASDGSGTDESGAILLDASGSGVDEGEALLYEEGTGDHIVNPVLQIGGNFVFEGATDNEFETTLSITDPTADRTVTIQDKTGTVALQGRDIDDIIVLNGTDASGTDEASAIILDGDATSVVGVVVNVGEALLYEEGVNDHILNPTFEGVEEFIILEESLEGTPSFVLKENVDSSSLDARFAYQPATSDNLLGSLFIPPAAGGVQFIMPVSDGDNDQVLATDGSGNLSFKNQSSGMSLSNDANNRVVTATGSGSGNGEANLTFDGSTLAVTGNITVADAGTIGSASDADAISISSGGVVNISATTANTSTTSGALTVAGGVGIAENLTVGEKLRLKSDGAQLFFGASSELKFFHTADHGLALIHSGGTGDNLPVIFQLKSEEDAIVADEVIASLEFAAGDSDGTDGATVAAGIHAIAEGTFSASANATKLVFTTGVSETAAASATAKMTLSSAGLLTIADDFVIKDEGTIGTATSPNAIKIEADGDVDIANNDLKLSHDGSIIKFGTNTEIALTHNHNVGLLMTSTAYAPLARRGEDVFIVLDQTAAGGTDAGDNVIMDASAASTDVGDDIIGEDEVFLHSGMQRNVLNIFNSGGKLLNSVAGFAPGAI